MLIPRYSLARMLLIVTVCAVISLIISFAVRAQPWALGISLALATLALCMLIYALSFIVAYGMATLRGSMSAGGKLRARGGAFGTSGYPSAAELSSPFATADRPPPQFVPKVDSD